MDSQKRNRVNELATELARSTSREADLLREFLDLQFEDAKSRLVDAQPEEFARIQGEARSYEKLSRQLNAAAALLRTQQGA